MTRRSLFLSLIVVHAILWGCAAAPGERVSAINPPPDFTLDVTVLSGDPNAGEKPAHLRTSRFVIFPDGSFHSEIAANLDAGHLPPRTRVLDEFEMREVWRMIFEQGFADPVNADPVGNIQLIEALEGQMTHLIVVRADGRLITFGRTRRLDEPAEPAVRSFVRALAQLAWASDSPEAAAARFPKRYDFGPDPYAKYRTNAATAGGEQ